MVDLEPYVGEIVLICLSRPLPYIVKDGPQFQPAMLPGPPAEPGKPQSPPMPAITDMLQGRIDKRLLSNGGANYFMTYVNMANRATRISVAIDPKLVDAVYSFSSIAIATPGEVPPDPPPGS